MLSLGAAILLTAGASAQTLTVGEGEATNERLPISGFYNDCVDVYTHFIYPASDVAGMSEKIITGMTFYATENIADASANAPYAVSLKEVEETSLNSRVTTDLTKVYEGKLTIVDDKLVVTFTNGFEYQGGNLLVSFVSTSRGEGYKKTAFKGIEATGAGYFYYNSNGSTQNFLPKATFTYEELQADKALVDKNALDFGSVPVNILPGNGVVTVTNKGTNAFTPKVTISGSAFSTAYTPAALAHNESAMIPVKFDAAIGEYTGTMTIDCGAAGTFEVALLGSVIEAVYEITVADGGTSDSSVPMNTLWWDTEGHATQVIYDKSDLAYLSGKAITRVKYYPKNPLAMTEFGGEATLSFGTSDANTFSSTTALPVTAVGKWVPTEDGTLEIVLDSPYLYDGESNLVVEFRVTTEGSGYQRPSVAFEGTRYDTYHYVSLYNTSSSFSRSAFMPKTTFAFLDQQVEPVEPVITLTPAPGTYTEDQVVTVAVENMPEGGKVQYMLGEATAWTDYTDNGITITATTDLTVAVLDAAGQIVARQMGTYTINKPIVITFTPDGGEYTEAVNVKINVENMPEGAVLKYSQVDAEDEFINMDVVYTEDGVDVTESGYILAVVYDANNTYLADAFSEDFVINIPVEYTITMTPAPGTYDGPQTVTVAVEPELPQGAKIVYTYVEAQPTQGAPRKAEGDVEENDYLDSGIEITTSGLLTIIVRDADGQELASTEGEYVINGTHVGIEALTAGKPVKGIRYYNAAGQQSTQLQQGVNIVVVTYDDGTQAVAKVVK